MKNPKRGPNQIEKTMGLLWNIIDDTISALGIISMDPAEARRMDLIWLT